MYETEIPKNVTIKLKKKVIIKCSLRKNDDDYHVVYVVKKHIDSHGPYHLFGRLHLQASRQIPSRT